MGRVAAADIIARLQLQPHPEGGHYRETFRDARADAGGRAASTAIYFLLARGERSHWHRIDAAEIWPFTAGDALSLRANCRRPSCLPTPGSPPKAAATGRWSDARWHRVLILRLLSWQRRTGFQRSRRKYHRHPEAPSPLRRPRRMGGLHSSPHPSRRARARPSSDNGEAVARG